MKLSKKIFILLLIFTFTICGCNSPNKEIISGQDAKVEVINNAAILVDVRTEEEYNTNHLGGAVSLPLDNIETDAKNKIPSKDKIVIVYCNSGTRSKTAKEKLLDLGYKTVYNLGAMSNWYE